jgi:phenylacetate-coenzyme A ligase PaaK-like adenylate-forming protein
MVTLNRISPLTPFDELRAGIAAGLEREIPAHVQRMGWSADRIAEHRRQRLRALLHRAITRSPFHASRLTRAGVDPRTFELSDLRRLPVMTKEQMTERFDEVVTDRRLSRAIVEGHLGVSATTPSLLLGRYVCLASGGSSGVRGVFVQTLREYASFCGSVMRPGMARILAAGGPPPGGLVLGMVAAASPVHSTGMAAATALDGPLRIVGAPATLPIDQIVARLNAGCPHVLLGYPATLAQLAAERTAGRLQIAPLAVTSTSEPLGAEHRAAIADGFGVPAADTFASTEGLVGHSEPGGTVLRFASDMCIAELVDADNRPVAPGTPSAKVLVTNLHNLTQPLIRYELSDCFVADSGAPADGHLHATIEGRAEDTFRYGAVEVHPLVVGSALVACAQVRCYQVRQTADGVDVAVCASGPLDLEGLRAALTAALGRAGLAGPRVAIQIVDDIARHPQSGKARRFVALP